MYYATEQIPINVELTRDGTPVDGLVGIQVNNPVGAYALFRTITFGAPEILGDIDITFAAACNREGEATNVSIRGQLGYFMATISNTANTEQTALVTITVYDKAGFLLGSATWGPGSVTPGQTTIILSVPLPEWAVEGKGTICVNVYTDYPEKGGTPYCSEKQAKFFLIDKNYKTVLENALGEFPAQNQIGDEMLLRVPRDARPGAYTIKATAKSLVYVTSNQMSVDVKSAGIPPSADFVWSPINSYPDLNLNLSLYPYTNMSILFDASSSSAGGFEDEIISYTWDFGDGSFVSTTTPVYTKTEGYSTPGIYNVTLTIVDSEGLWATVTKPIKILPPTGPTANFTWTPTNPIKNQKVTFDASSTLIGWNGTGPALILSYTWDFGDGNVTVVTEPTVIHTFTNYGQFNVTLTVTDNQGFSDSVMKTVTIIERILGDVNGDGKVDLTDLVLVALAYGSVPGDPNWNPDADLNQDGTIGLADLVTVALHYGESI